MRFGVHLPQSGRAASAANIAACARQAEELGFADVWVSDHVLVPSAAPYPPAFIFDPLVSLTWAAAATSTVGLGTSVLLLPLRSPVVLAKQLATLDLFAGERLTLGAGSGWLRGEFEALGVSMAQRHALTDECIDVLRACWTSRPVSVDGPTYSFDDMVILPLPKRPIPVWVGGTGPKAVARAIGRGDGWHGIGALEELTGIARTLRDARSEPEFTLSSRVDWDGLRTPEDEIRAGLAGYAEAGFDHLVISPSQSDLDSWQRSVQRLAELCGLTGSSS